MIELGKDRKGQEDENRHMLQKFKDIFGFLPKKGREREIIGALGRLYNECKEWQSEGGIYPQASRFERLGIKSNLEWDQRMSAYLSKLESTLKIAQKYVNEDLSFLLTLAKEHHDRNMKINDLIASVKLDSSKITTEQKAILQGKITLKNLKKK